jgi:hypothetical protein
MRVSEHNHRLRKGRKGSFERGVCGVARRRVPATRWTRVDQRDRRVRVPKRERLDPRESRVAEDLARRRRDLSDRGPQVRRGGGLAGEGSSAMGSTSISSVLPLTPGHPRSRTRSMISMGLEPLSARSPPCRTRSGAASRTSASTASKAVRLPWISDTTAMRTVAGYRSVTPERRAHSASSFSCRATSRVAGSGARGLRW